MTRLINNKAIGLDDNLIRKVTTFILQYKPVDKIVLFGSRSRDDYQKTSDIDLAIFSARWTSTDINLVLDWLEENIPTVLRFNLLLFDKLQNISLKSEIENGVIIYDNK